MAVPFEDPEVKKGVASLARSSNEMPDVCIECSLTTSCLVSADPLMARAPVMASPVFVTLPLAAASAAVATTLALLAAVSAANPLSRASCRLSTRSPNCCWVGWSLVSK